jgi:hypothetical protein
MDRETLRGQLREGARGSRPGLAAVELIAAACHGDWLDDEDFTSAAVQRAGDGSARIDWDRALKFSETSGGSSGQVAVLQFAALIGLDSLRLGALDRVLDGRNRALVVRAVADALGVNQWPGPVRRENAPPAAAGTTTSAAEAERNPRERDHQGLDAG